MLPIVAVLILLLGVLLLYLAAGSFQRRAEWFGAARPKARVVDVEYREGQRTGEVVEDARASTLVTLRFSLDGEEHTVRKEYRGIVGTPTWGQTVPLRCSRASGTWATRREIRSHWLLLLALGACCLLAGMALLVGGQGLLDQVAGFRLESPNLPGSVCCAVVGIAATAGCAGCALGLLPALIRSATQPIRWSLKQALGRFEPVQAQCDGVIRKVEGDDTNFYPLFTCYDRGRPVRWYSGSAASRSRYQPGGQYSLYRDRRTGAYVLEPSGFDAACVVLSLFPIGFCLMFTASLALCAVGTLYAAAVGFLACL